MRPIATSMSSAVDISTVDNATILWSSPYQAAAIINLCHYAVSHTVLHQINQMLCIDLLCCWPILLLDWSWLHHIAVIQDAARLIKFIHCKTFSAKLRNIAQTSALQEDLGAPASPVAFIDCLLDFFKLVRPSCTCKWLGPIQICILCSTSHHNKYSISTMTHNQLKCTENSGFQSMCLTTNKVLSNVHWHNQCWP